ncbi:MAG: transcription activator effector [Beijerinckiaceae bacterium]|nr:MAG: transcription activator effector [Beijerinckiaceae bacterium]
MLMPGNSPTLRKMCGALLFAGLLLAAPVAAQQASPPAPQAPATQAPAVPVPAPPATPPAEVAKPVEPVKPAGDGGGEMRDVAARPVIRLKGQSTWNEGFASLKKALALLDAEARRLNLPREGNPMAYFVDSDDIGFTYEAMLPLGAPAPAGTAFGKEFDAALSPGGRAVVFSHEGAYDEIDTAYEALTAWLDDKNLVSTGKFLEEYELVPEKSDETTLKLKIVVFLK